MPDDARRQILGVNPPPFAPDPGAEGVIGFTATALGNALLVAMSGAPVVVVVDLDLADDEVAIGGPDSGGTRRLFQGRVDGANNIIESVPVLSGAQALALGKAEDTAFADADVGVMPLGVRRDADGPEAADGDYTPLQTDATGLLKTRATVSGDVAIGPTVTPGTGATDLGKAEDAVAANGDVGVFALAVRRDADAATAADGDYSEIQTDAIGHLKVSDPAHDLSADATLAVTAVGTGASVVIAAADATRRAITIQNRGPGPLYINPGAAATTAHFRLGNGENKTFRDAAAGSWEAISSGGGASAVVITEDE